MDEFKRLESKADALYKSHNHLADVHSILNEVISVSVIIVSAIITAFLPFLKQENINVTLANSILAFYITFITTITKSYKPAEKHQQHRISSQKYLSLKSKIRNKMMQCDTVIERNIPAVQEIIEKFEKLRKESPFIPNKTYDKFLTLPVTQEQT
jgi:uncharacterized protein YbcC (UPF0753/DUF2309 family)